MPCPFEVIMPGILFTKFGLAGQVENILTIFYNFSIEWQVLQVAFKDLDALRQRPDSIALTPHET